MEPKINVDFTCQRCLQPLKLDSSFGSVGEHTLAELSLPIHNHPDVDLESEAVSLDRYTPAFRLTESGTGANGFTVVGKEGELNQISHKMRVTSELLDMLSSNSDIDHPLCEECTDQLLELLEQQLHLTEVECNDYNRFLDRLQAEEDPPHSLESLEKELAEMKLEEESLRDELSQLQVKEKAAREAVAKQEKEKERIAAEEERYWREYTRHRRDLLLAEDQYRSLECQLSYTNNQLDKLSKTNVFNATFHIWHSGHFGTINSFRLGRLPSAPVDWSEINAAWGQTALLLSALARKMDLTFERYRLVPYGNHSYIEDIAENRELPLYGSGGFRFLWDTKFDAAMVAFLECLQQFKEAVERGDSGFSLPYRMERGRIEDSTTGNSFSIKIQLNSEEQWTKALKYVLTNLKWGLAWVSSQFAKDRDIGGS